MKHVLKSIFASILVLSSSQSFALNCNDLYTGNTVEDHFTSGKIKKLQSLESIPSEYGDSSPLPTVLVKKSSLKSDDAAKVSLEIYLYKGKQKQLFNKFTSLEIWSENVQYYFFKDFENEKLNEAVFIAEGEDVPAKKQVGVAKIELLLKLDSKVVCKKQMHVDNH
jgi:hypothetical protein